jgi:hypothetical protein
MCRKEFIIRRRGAGYRRASSATDAPRDRVVSPDSSRKS